MTSVPIPNEAVEAAARAYRERQAEIGYPKWEDLPEWGREMRVDLMRAALEAAAPHLMAPTLRALVTEIGGDPATAVTDPAVHRLLKMMLDRADAMEAAK